MSLKDQTDGQLVARARAGDTDAFGQLVERHVATARRIALRMVGQEEVTRELLQESMLQAYLSLSRLREAERFKNWFFGIVLNLCRGYVRKQMRRRGITEELAGKVAFDLQSFYQQPPDPQEMAEVRELHRMVLSAVRDLPRRQREAILLFYYETLSIQEIAALLGVSVGSVKVRLHRARSQLRQQISQKFPEIANAYSNRTRRKEMVKVSIADVIKRDDKTILLLVDEKGQRVLPIWIGDFEGAAIVMGLRGIATPRPMTFNFIASILEALGAELEEARIESLKQETFYGVAKLRDGDSIREVDARPSDVLALAVRTGSPIYASEQVMQEAGKAIREGIEMPEDIQQETEMPYPSGEGMEAILKEIEDRFSWPAGKPGSEQE